MKAKKWEILTAVAAGAAIASAGWLGSGCAFVWMAAARADDAVTVACPASGYATHDFGTSDPADLVRVSAIQVLAKPTTDAHGLQVTAMPAQPSFDGSTAHVVCYVGAAVTFLMR